MRDQRITHLDRAIEMLLIALLVFMPLAFGVVQAWSEEIVIALAAALSICFLVRLRLAPDSSITWNWAYVPVAVFVFVVVVQLVPMPASIVRVLSPNTVARKTELLGDLANTRGYLSYVTISFYPFATRHDLRIVLAIVAVFVVVLNVYRQPERILRLLWIIAFVGAAVAFIALGQQIFGNAKIYWFVESPHGSAKGGPFVNHSHYAQFMNLSLGAILAVVFVRLHEAFHHRRATPSEVSEYFGSPDAKPIFLLLAAAALGVATVFASLSRGGMISTLTAATLTTLLLSSKRSLRGPAWIMVLLALAAFVSVLYIGFDAVYDRLGTLSSPGMAEGGRWQILKDIAVAWTRFPVWGTGLGTHSVVYPEFDRSTTPSLAAHAENEYAQAAEETGLLGVVALVFFGVLVWTHYARAIRSSRAPIHSAAYGLGFGLVAIMVHSLSDFGQHLPANAMLTVVSCALLINISQVGRAAPAEAGRRFGLGISHGKLWGGVLAVVCAVWGWALLDADAARRAESHWGKVRVAENDLARNGWEGSETEYVYLLRQAMKARDAAPACIEYAHWLPVYRYRAVEASCTTDPNTGELLVPPEALEFAERIVGELANAVVRCPTFGPTWCVLGQLEKFMLGRDAEGTRHIERGRRLAPCDPTVCVVVGMLRAEDGDIDAAFDEWKRAVHLDEHLYREVASLLLERERPDLAEELAAGRVARLIWLRQALEGDQRYGKLATDLQITVQTLLERECNKSDTSAAAWMFAELGRIYGELGRLEEAIGLFGRALAKDPGRVEWGVELAKLQVEKGMTQEARGRLREVLILRPGFPPAQRMLDDLGSKDRPTN
jgi:O-antigen ligase